MPIGLEPNETYPVWLATDEPRPEHERPTFLFRFLVRAQVRRHRELREAVLRETDEATAEAMVDEAIRIGLAGWRNMPIDYDPDRLDDVLTTAEKWELCCGYPVAGMIAEREKKASASPSTSATANSAGDAGAGA